jgi:hypothetical protein
LPLHHQDFGADLHTGIGVQVEVPEERLHAKLRGGPEDSLVLGSPGVPQTARGQDAGRER